jgi:hypothetical protein
LSSGYHEPTWEPPNQGDAGTLGDGAVVVETVGPYEIVRSEPADPVQLASWLTSLGYAFNQADIDAIAPYIARHYTVVAVRVASPKPIDGTLPPIALTWAGSTLALPAALGTGDPQPLTVYIAAEGRYELPDATVPYARFTTWSDTTFLTRNDITLVSTMTPDDDPVAYHIDGDPSFHEVDVVEQIEYVPVTKCQDKQPVGCGCGNCSTQRTPRFDLGVIVVAIAIALRRRRRR